MQNLKYLELKKVVLIGASTGGPGQIEKIILSLPTLTDTTIIIAQHLPEGFVESFAKRLNNLSQNSIQMIQDKMELQNSNIYVCYGNTTLTDKHNKLFFNISNTKVQTYNPDINTIFHSFVTLASDVKIMSVILTGIGADGVNACKELSLNGSICITESQESAIVDGMPNRARAEVPNIEVLDMNEIIQKVKEFSY